MAANTIQKMREDLNNFLADRDDSIADSIDQVIDSLTHPMSCDSGDVRAMMWLLSKAIEVPILVKEIEELKKEVIGIQKAWDAVAGNK